MLSRGADALLLCETHASKFLQKQLEQRNSDTHRMVWGDPVDPRVFTGVAACFAKQSSWSVSRLAPKDKECALYETQGRLMCIQVFRGEGKRSMIFYLCYGEAGARWEQVKKKRTLKMLRAIQRDTVLRGDVCAFICGDMNLELADVSEWYDSMWKLGWCDASKWGSAAEQAKPTSRKGAGSKIDWVLCNKAACNGMETYEVVRGLKEKDHDIIKIRCKMPIASQVQYMPRRAGTGKVSFQQISAESTLKNNGTMRACRVEELLSKGKIDEALQHWNKVAEQCLKQIPCDLSEKDIGTGRGKVRVHKLAV